jgi:hypothetical protein
MQCSISVSVELFRKWKTCCNLSFNIGTVSEEKVALVTFSTHSICLRDQSRLCLSACSKFKITDQIQVQFGIGFDIESCQKFVFWFASIKYNLHNI